MEKIYRKLKKLLRYTAGLLAAILIICAIILSWVNFKFNNFHPEDPYPVVEENLGYFTNDYMSARSAFLGKISFLKNKFSNVTLDRISVADFHNSGLTADVCYIPATNALGTLLIISSGVHGVEGHVGSAVQSMFLQEYLSEDLLRNCGVLLLHAVNPYGFYVGRRVTESNIDLNRNCSVSADLYSSINEGYTMVEDFINPRERLNLRGYEMRFFLFRAANLIRKHGMPALRQAVLGGQYQYPEGIFYGGDKLEPQIGELIPLIKEVADPYKQVIVIDLHTGFGERGKLHLMSNAQDAGLRNRIQNFYGSLKIDYGDAEDQYTNSGGFVWMVFQSLPDKNCIPMTFEYGTLNSQTLMGSVKSLQIVSAENQAYHYGCTRAEDMGAVKRQFRDMFYPESAAWRSNAIEKSRLVLDEIIPRL